MCPVTDELLGLPQQLLLKWPVCNGPTRSCKSLTTSRLGRPVKKPCTWHSLCSRTALLGTVRNENGASLYLTKDARRDSQSLSILLHTSILDQNSVPHGLPAEFLLLESHNEIGCRRAVHSRNPFAMIVTKFFLHNRFWHCQVQSPWNADLT